MQSIAREVGLTPGSKNKKELVEFILKEGDRKKLYKKLGLSFEFKAIHGCFVAILLFILGFVLNKSEFNPFYTDPICECKFEDKSDTLQVLILPFNNRTDQNNAGDIIAKRLGEIVKQENLNANIEYCEQFSQTEGLTTKRVNEIAKELNADLVIYGDMEKEFCDDKKICLNWISNDTRDYEIFDKNISRDNVSYISYDNAMLRNVNCKKELIT